MNVSDGMGQMTLKLSSISHFSVVGPVFTRAKPSLTREIAMMNVSTCNVTMSSHEAQAQLERRLKDVLEQRETTEVSVLQG
jgi:hypothetical protein